MTVSASSLVDAAIASRIRRLPMNEEAFLDLYARTAAPLARYLRRLTGDATLAEDLLQEAYLRLLSQARVPDDEAHQRNYLFKIGTNLARDHFRRRWRQEPLADEDGPSTAQPPPLRDRHAQEPSDVWAALGRVTPRDRELLLLAYVEGLTHAEISQITGLMRASLKPLLFRARKRFAAALAEAGLVPDLSPGGPS
jgi:RNA polymerase sigma-70 factor (ECF subfamily)